MKRLLTGLLLFLLASAGFVAGLKALNLVPLMIQKEALRRYGSIEDVRANLRLDRIYTPAYFPQDLSWPASRILAQGRPYKAVLMEFRDARTVETSLVISQSEYRGESHFEIEITRVKERAERIIRGRRAELTVGRCGDAEPCSSLVWDEGKFRISVIMKSGPFELIRLSESMIE